MGPYRDVEATRPYSSNADFRSVTQPYTSRCAAGKSLPVGAVAT